MSQRLIQDGLIPQPALSRTLQRRLSAPIADHGFDVVSDPPPPIRVREPEKAPKEADDAQRT